VNRPAVLFSFIAGFLIYWLLAKAGLRPPVVPLEESDA
jgi:hypothetical protein